jgi:hypothetical protein
MEEPIPKGDKTGKEHFLDDLRSALQALNLTLDKLSVCSPRGIRGSDSTTDKVHQEELAHSERMERVRRVREEVAMLYGSVAGTQAAESSKEGCSKDQ